MARNVQNLGLGLARGQARMALEEQRRAARQQLVAQALGQIQAGNQQAANVGMQMQQLEAVAARQAAAQKAQAEQNALDRQQQSKESALNLLLRERQVASQEGAQAFREERGRAQMGRAQKLDAQDLAGKQAFGSAGRVADAQRSTPEQAMLDPLSITSRQAALDQAIPAAADDKALQESLVAQDQSRVNVADQKQRKLDILEKAKTASKPLPDARRSDLKSAKASFEGIRDIGEYIREEGGARTDDSGKKHGIDFGKMAEFKRIFLERGLPPSAAFSYAKSFDFDTGVSGMGGGGGGSKQLSFGETRVGEEAAVELEKIVASFTDEERILIKRLDEMNRAVAQGEPGVLTDKDWQFYQEAIGLSVFDGPAIFEQRYNQKLVQSAQKYYDEFKDNTESGFIMTSPFKRSFSQVFEVGGLRLADEHTGSKGFVGTPIDKQQSAKAVQRIERRRSGKGGKGGDLGKDTAENIKSAVQATQANVADASEGTLDATTSYVKDQIGLIPEAKKAGANVLIEKYNKATTKEAKKVAGQELAQYFSDNGPVEKVRVMWGMLTGEKADNAGTRKRLEAAIARAQQLQSVAEAAANRHAADGDDGQARRARAEKDKFIKMEQDARRELSALP